MGSLLSRYSECYEILRTRAAQRQTITYGELAANLGLPLPRQEWNTVLDPICDNEKRRTGRDLSLVVVYGTGPAKGLGRYFSNRGAPRSKMLDPKDIVQVMAFKAELQRVFDAYQK
jgi:hypothetical protein